VAKNESSDAWFAETKNPPTQRFVPDSPLEGDGFELPVPREIGAGAPLSKRLWEQPVNRSNKCSL